MVIYDLHPMRIAFPPQKAYPPTVVDPNAIFPFSISGQSFEPIARGDAQIVEMVRGIQQSEFPPGYPVQGRRESPRELACENTLGLLVAEALDHGLNHNVSRY
jgi:hypothetical protein